MRFTRFFLTAPAALLFACGGGGGDDGGGIDAPNGGAVCGNGVVESGEQCDDNNTTSGDGCSSTCQTETAQGLMGLGQKCVAAMGGADCPMNASGCLTFSQGAVNGYCTTICDMTAKFTSDAQGNPPGNALPNPAAGSDTKCTAIYTGGAAGVASCNIPVNFMPAPTGNPPKFPANTQVTFLYVCGIDCGAGNTCPGTNLTCNTQDGNSCEPN